MAIAWCPSRSCSAATRRKLAALAAANGGLRWSTDRDACLAESGIAIYFDATATGGRADRIKAALDAGKHVYVEKPLAETLADALDLARQAERAGLKNGVVQDKLFLPGLTQIAQALRDRILRPRSVDPARFRLVGIRRHALSGAAAELELPQGHRRRADPRYVRPLALHLRSRCWGRSKPCRAAT